MTRCMLVAGLAVVLALGNVWAGGEKKDPAKQDTKQKTRPDAKVDLDALFKKLDADGDGKISPEEFKKLEEHYKPKARTGGQFDPDQLKKLIDRFGKGGAGKIDPDQLKKLLERFGKKGGGAGGFDPELLKKLIEDLGKGGAGGLDLEQLKKLLERFGKQENDPETVRALPRAVEVRALQVSRNRE